MILPPEATSEHQRRWNICKACEFLDKDTTLKLHKCKKCGCPMETKTAVPWAHCPVNKW